MVTQKRKFVCEIITFKSMNKHDGEWPVLFTQVFCHSR